ncbi:MAG: ABC transporter permease [Chloroflexi bacterium]|nr:ABC transporter permease [Chloroflexota bacterium]MCL5075263.1 ABC transporter permease [Chloroflexota bacterium]
MEESKVGLNQTLYWPLRAKEGVELVEVEPISPWRRAWRHLRRDHVAIGSLVLIVVFCLAAIFAPWVSRHSPYFQDYTQLDAWPSATHWLGTDDLGRDILARLLYGLRVSFAIAIFTELITAILGIGIGVVAGYLGRWIDSLASRITDLVFAFPGLLLVIFVMSLFGGQFDTFMGGLGRLFMVFLIFSLVGWPAMTRVIRAQVLAFKEQQFVEAAMACGTSELNIIRRHILPGLWGLSLVWVSIDIRRVILNEAILSLLGLGVQPPMSSLGIMIAAGANRLETNWGEVFWPSLALCILVVAFSYVGDGLRDAFDVRMRD